MTSTQRIRVLILCSAVLVLAPAGSYAAILAGDAIEFSHPGRGAATSVVVADINGDGHLDVLLGEDGGASLWLNDGFGALSEASWAPPTNISVLSITVGDVDQDGDIDVVVGATLFAQMFKNTGGILSNTAAWTSLFPSVTNGIGLGDVDGDGDLDLVCANGYTTTSVGRANHIYRNDGGSFPTQPTWTQSDPPGVSVAVALGDVNGDGLIDAVFGNSAGANRLYLGDAAGLLASSFAWEDTDAISTRGVALGDISGDGILDLVCANWTVAVNLYLGNGSDFSATADWQVASSVLGAGNGVTLGDVDLDGDLDIAVARQIEKHVYLNIAGVPDTIPSWQSNDTWAKDAVALADLDGDGDLEYITAGKHINEIPNVRPEVMQGAIYENITPLYPDVPDWTSTPIRDARTVELADVDLDGDLDLFVAHFQDASVIYEFNGTDYGTAPVWSSRVDPQWGTYPTTHDGAFGDMDNDGDLDLYIANGGFEHTIYRNVDGSFPPDSVIAGHVRAGGVTVSKICAWGDFAGDGFPDVMVNIPPAAFGDVRLPNINGVPSWTSDWDNDPCLGEWELFPVDVDDDGDVDLLTVTGRDQGTSCPGADFRGLMVYRNSSNLLSEVGREYPIEGFLPHGGTVGYFNADPWIDVVAVGTTPPVLMVNDGGGGFAKDNRWAPAVSGHERAASSDINGDGFTDVVMTRREPSAGRTRIDMFMSENGQLPTTPRSMTILKPNVQPVTMGDIDADGDVDLVLAEGSPLGVATFGPGVTRVYFARRTPVFKGDFAVPVGQLPANAVVVGDVEITPAGTNTYDVSFALYDVESDLARVTLEYQYEGEGIWRPMQVGTVPATLASSSSGTPHGFTWDVTEIAFTSRPIVVRLQATDVGGAVGASAQHVSRVIRPVGQVEPTRPSMIVPTTVAVFPTVTVGDTVSAQVLIRNIGNEVLSITGIVLPSVDMTIAGSAPSTVAPGERDTLNVLFHPVAGVTSTGDIQIHGTDPTRPSVAVPTSIDVRTLQATTRMLWSEPELPIDQDVTVVVTPFPQVRVEAGYLFHRATGAPAFADSIPLLASRDGFVVVVPRAALVESGFEYFIRLDNSGVHGTDPPGAPGTFFSRDVSPPTTLTAAAIPNDGVRYAQGAPVTVQAILPPGSVFQRGWVYYRQGATADYDTVAMTGSGDVAEGEVPGIVADVRGVDYWLEVETISATLTAPAVAPQSNPYSIQTTLTNVDDPRSHPALQYRMFSFPVDVQGTAQGAVVDDLGGPDRKQWRILSHTGAPYVDIDEIPRFEHGKAYWLMSRKAYRLDTAPEVSLSTDTSMPFEIGLNPGWNLVGQPFPFDVAWSGVTIEAPAAVPGPPQTYNGSRYVDATVLEPFSGYWVQNDADSVVSIWIPPVEENTSPMPAPSLDWAISITASGEDTSAQNLILAVSEKATDKRDTLDRLLPPAAPEQPMEIYLVDQAGRSLSRDVRAETTAPGWGHTWTFDVAVSGNGRIPVALGFDFDAVPDDVSILLLDREVKRTHDIGTASHVEVFITGSARKASVDDARFVLLVGDEQYIEEHRNLLPALPTRTALHQNFPNPFNPTTVIRYELADNVRVSLKIYDVRGALVRTLEDRNLPAGRYEIGWDGIDNRGVQVASGIYFYRLVSSEGVVLTRKMVLLK